ncbi:hypothetical protein QAD02_001836 [Eretmocerus hayati]|uniref:Uncharacterized protein n=1 Tax=Eretmocerus hayati TaxID=131215 RepID=A0ACC2NHK4_9HYME|nr:hypothetical protein QAD02_001836 [Eretmocerus hayati]
MAAILRVKRKKEDEPLDALLIACKRQKVETDESPESNPYTAVVKFAGTIEKRDDSVVEQITKTLNKEAVKASFKRRPVDITKKMRELTKQDSSESRYKIVNSMRSMDTSLSEHLEEEIVNIIDVEDACVVPDDKNNDNYVYDLYFTKTNQTLALENLVSVRPIEEDLVFEDYYRDNEGDYEGESEDSNSESNWRNDYPDSDHSNESIGENDIRRAMRNLNVEDELSSDDEDFVYGLDEDDVERYGYKYAKYKARMNKEKEGLDNSCSANSDLSEDDESQNDELDEYDGQCIDDE